MFTQLLFYQNKDPSFVQISNNLITKQYDIQHMMIVQEKRPFAWNMKIYIRFQMDYTLGGICLDN